MSDVNGMPDGGLGASVPMEARAPARAPVSARRGALVAVNAVLALALGATFVLDASGQAGGAGGRGRGDYTLLGGEIDGGNSNAIYIIDAANQEMIAMRWDSSRGQLQGLGYRNLKSDTEPKEQR